MIPASQFQVSKGCICVHRKELTFALFKYIHNATRSRLTKITYHVSFRTLLAVKTVAMFLCQFKRQCLLSWIHDIKQVVNIDRKKI